MKNKEQIIDQYKKKIRYLKKHNNYYFKDDAPQITDSEYDAIKKETLELEKKYSYLKKIKSISNIVGAKPSNKFKKVKHLQPMLSLSNAFDKNDMEDFQKKINNFLSLKNTDLELFS